MRVWIALSIRYPRRCSYRIRRTGCCWHTIPSLCSGKTSCGLPTLIHLQRRAGIVGPVHYRNPGDGSMVFYNPSACIARRADPMAWSCGATQFHLGPNVFVEDCRGARRSSGRLPRGMRFDVRPDTGGRLQSGRSWRIPCNVKLAAVRRRPVVDRESAGRSSPRRWSCSPA